MSIKGFRQKTEASDDRIVMDPSQRAVVDLADGRSAAVIGAPGSGKTATLVELVVERVTERGYSPDDILVIAPNRRSATGLRDRLALRLAVPTNGPLARTLSSIAFQIVTTSAALAATEPPRLLTGAEQDAIIAEMLRGHEEDGTGPSWPESLTPDVRALKGFRTELRELMMRRIEAGLAPSALEELGRRHDRPEWVAAATFIREFEQVVDRFDANFLDSAELIAEATVQLRAGTGLGETFDGLRLIAVDDLHEQGPAALEMLSVLASRGVAIVAFGDSDVAVSNFRGSDPAALPALGARLGVPVERCVLSTVYRGNAAIRCLVTEVTARVGTAGGIAHRAASVHTSAVEPVGVSNDDPDMPPIVRIEAVSPAAEHQHIARVLREHNLFRGIPWSRMAVIVRSGAGIPVLARALALAEVPTSSPVGARNVRDGYAASQLILAAAIAIGRLAPSIDDFTALATGPLCGLDTLALRRLRLSLRYEELAGEGNRSGDELLREAFLHPNGFASIDSAGARTAGRFASTLAAASAAASEGASVEEILWLFWERSKLAETWTAASLGTGLIADEANRHLDSVMTLFTAAKRFVERHPREPAGRFIDEVMSAEVPEDSLTPQSAADAVWIGTPSAVVGADYDVVVVAALQDGVWPNPQLRGSLLYPQMLSQVVAGLPVAELDARAEVLSDELRMFALAVSRAGRQLVLAATVNEDEQPSPFLRFPAVQAAPMRDPREARHPLTLRGLTGRLRRDLSSSHDFGGRVDAASALARLAVEGIAGADPGEWYGLLEPSTTAPLVDLGDPDARVSVSPSKLENFEKSEVYWFIDTMAAVPSGLAAGIGTVVHAAMEHAGKIPLAEVSDEMLTPEALWEQVDEHWSELRFEAPWLGEASRRKTQGLVKALSEYLLDFHHAGNTVISAEGSFQVDLGPVRLNGKIDRVERDASGKVVIVDLKTGASVPTKKQVQEHAQMTAYQLALASGAIEGATPDDPSGGAALLYVSGGSYGKNYRYLLQKPLTPEEQDAFVQRVSDAGARMAGSTFVGVRNLPERDPASSFTYRIHLVAAVSA